MAKTDFVGRNIKERNKDICEKWKNGMTYREIADLYNLSQQRIWQIVDDEFREDIPRMWV